VSDSEIGAGEHISLCETLDRVLNKGVVIHGDLTISVANVDLIYLGCVSCWPPSKRRTRRGFSASVRGAKRKCTSRCNGE
jgi:hypothetical protein